VGDQWIFAKLPARRKVFVEPAAGVEPATF
jgi:hypothetical protein